MGVPSIVYDLDPRYCHNNTYPSNALLDYGYAFAPLVNVDMQMNVHNHTLVYSGLISDGLSLDY